jgi:hypothetical protein
MDRPIWGAMNIGRVAGITDRNGNVDRQQVYYAISRGYLDVTKAGRQLVSTPRRILRSLAGAQMQEPP